MRKLFPVLLCVLSLSGCGASVPQVVTVATLAVEATCAGAAKLCETFDPACGASACHAVHDVCGALPVDAHVQLACAPAAQ